MIRVTYVFDIEEDKFREMYEEDEADCSLEEYAEDVADDMCISDIEDLSHGYEKSVSCI